MRQEIQTFIHGVSRQPDRARLPGQVEEAVNQILPVDRGGFEKRHGARYVAGLAPTTATLLHPVDRDATEKYVISVPGNGTLQVIAADGTPRTVTLDAGTSGYLTGNPESDFVLSTLADYTLILNRTITVAAGANATLGYTARAVVGVLGTRDGTFGVRVNTTNYTVTYATPGAVQSPTDCASAIRTALLAAFPTWTIGQQNGYLFIDAPADFTISAVESHTGFVRTWKDRVSSISELPPRAQDGTQFVVELSTAAAFHMRFSVNGANSFDGVWREGAKTGIPAGVDAATMPHGLVRQNDGSFRFQRMTWANRVAGTEDTAPLPDFVGRQITDIAFHRSRMVLLSGEQANFSQTNDLFNFFPERTTQVSDSDPFALTAPGGSVALLRWAVPFRRTLFLTANAAQFEVSAGEALSPRTASIELTTRYSHSLQCRPAVVGDSLFMVADDGPFSAVLEYYYDDTTLSNTATDVSRHVRSYLPGRAVQLAGDSVSGNVFLRTATDKTSVYVYTYHWVNNTPVQQAWHRWTMGTGLEIISMALLDGGLFVAVRNTASGVVWLERIPVSRPTAGAFPFMPRLDRHRVSRGTWNAGTGRTTWTHPVDLGTAALAEPAVLDRGRITLSREGAGVYSAPGNWSDVDVMVGLPFDSYVTMSRLYPRNGDVVLFTGRTQLRLIELQYVDTSQFDVEVQSEGRAPFVKPFSASILGAGGTQINVLPIRTGVFRVPVGSENTRATIIFRNNSRYPHLITGASWAATYHDNVRQG